MSSSHPSIESTESYSTWVGVDIDDGWAWQLGLSGQVDTSMGPSMLHNGFESAGYASVAMSVQPYSMPSSLNEDFSVPSLHRNPSCLATTTAPYPGLGHSLQAAESSHGNGPHGPKPIANSTHTIGTTSPGSKNTACGRSPKLISNGRIVRPLALKCEWRGCTYTGTFSHHAQLRRHVDTQHIKPGAFLCPIPRSRKTFNRRDNLRVHMRQIHGNDEEPWHSVTGEDEMHARGE